MEAAPSSSYLSFLLPLNSSQPLKRTSLFPHKAITRSTGTSFSLRSRLYKVKTRATFDENDQSASSPILLSQDEQESQAQTISAEVEESVKVLKNAAKTRKVPVEKVLSALSVMEKSKLDSSEFLEKLGGSNSPGRTWMLIFTAQKQLKKGSYFPITAVQRFDAAGKRIENGVYFGPIGCLTFEGKFTWKNRILAFVFECIRIKIGPLKPLEISLGQKNDTEPSTKDPFFIWFFIDEEIAVGRGKSGGTAFWVRCRRATI
ncbi:uncharacterized protein LOC126655655 [Mercurialis annua]|uniref:uncharacterized protein LOC126655655 n=1 Tax=Mercurialis annua TaxID=3986 RepID=UPI0021604962|nr:uncharacterized protein LOC126655655 [Mercurialis annua]